jgi:hypothetical protein
MTRLDRQAQGRARGRTLAEGAVRQRECNQRLRHLGLEPVTREDAATSDRSVGMGEASDLRTSSDVQRDVGVLRLRGRTGE